MIPQEKNPAFLRGLQDAFGTTAIEDIRTLPKGVNSDLIFRIVIRGSPYLLRIMTRIDESMDPRRIFACMSLAAGAGLAPAVRYTNAEEGISITEFIEAASFPATEALVQLPATLRRLHALPRFPKVFNYVTAHRLFIRRFRESGLLPKDAVEEIFTEYDRICAAYPRCDPDMVSCHNDLKPENILFDGVRVLLGGWQAAMVNDRYFDLAIVANFLVTSDADEWTYLERYFGRRPDEYERARFFLMRQVMHLFSATIFLLLGAAGKPVSQSENLPSFRDFHERIREGGIDLAESAMKIIYGRIHWEQLSQNLRGARFEDALRIVSDQHAYPESMSRLLPVAA